LRNLNPYVSKFSWSPDVIAAMQSVIAAMQSPIVDQGWVSSVNSLYTFHFTFTKSLLVLLRGNLAMVPRRGSS